MSNEEMKNLILNDRAYSPGINFNEFWKGFNDNTNHEYEENKEEFKTCFKTASPKLQYKINFANDKEIVAERNKYLKKLDGNLQIGDECGLVELTKRNSRIIETKLLSDGDYYPFTQTLVKYFKKDMIINNEIDIKCFDEELINNLNKNKNKINGALFAVLREIDRDNNTNVWRYGTNKPAFNRILNYIKNNDRFFNALKSKDGGEDLPDILTAIGIFEDYNGNVEVFNQKIKDELKKEINDGRSGLRSFASKVCKYLCEYICGNNDKYFVNDVYVRHALPFYLKRYNVKFPKNDKLKELSASSSFDKLLYSELHDSLSKLQDAAENEHNERLEKGEMDHIIWYSYKSFRL